ncbi:MAG TPA: lysine biosynthesis protein LysX [Thermoplasmata archaeon]|nr:lysine biosynthesis protein LysX [Thermoplasmata archaeon]
MSDGFRLGVFYTIVRPEEKAILAAAEARGLAVVRIDDAEVTFGLDRPDVDADLVLNRSVSHTRALYAARFFSHYGLPTINAPEVIEVAGDKILASLRLAERGIPTPKTVVALSPEAALKALDRVGYPAVLKPAVGSWGRLMAKVGSPDEAEQIVEHKSALGAPMHSIFYVQEYVPKPERDLRVLVVGERPIAGMYRRSVGWRTNAARGATTEPLALSPPLAELSLRAAAAMGGGVLAVDLMESPGGLVVHEVNPTPEFKALAAATGADVAGAIVDFAVAEGRR